MWTRQHKQRNTGRLIVPAVSAVFLAYFGYHAWHGEFGLNAKFAFQARAVDLQRDLDLVRNERMALERRAGLLHDGTLERDTLDEQARKALNLSTADELTIMLDDDIWADAPALP